VNKLAAVQKNSSSTFASSSNQLGVNGSMDITVGKNAMVSVAVSATDSLTDIATKINASSAKVSASVVYDGSNYQMLVKGDDTGATNAITFGGVDLGLSANQYQSAQDAEILFDGGITVTRSTNQFSDVIDGVNFAVTATTTKPANITVDRDQASLVKKINDVVNAYNAAIDYGHAITGFGELTAPIDELAGDSSVRQAFDRMQSKIGQTLPGLSGKYDMLAHAGVHTTQGGKLAVDTVKLQQALDTDFDEVQKLFVGDPDNNVSGAMAGLIDMVNLASDGKESLLQVRIDGIGKSLTRIEDDKFEMESRLDDYEAQLTNQFTQLEIMVAQIKAQESALGALANLPLANPQR